MTTCIAHPAAEPMCRKLPNMSPIDILGMPISGAPSMIIVIAAVPTAPPRSHVQGSVSPFAPPVVYRRFRQAHARGWCCASASGWTALEPRHHHAPSTRRNLSYASAGRLSVIAVFMHRCTSTPHARRAPMDCGREVGVGADRCAELRGVRRAAEFLFHATVESSAARLTPRSSAQRSAPTPTSRPQSIGARLAWGVLVQRCMKTAMTLSLPADAYERFLRVLGAWWCLGSSAVQPEALAQHQPRA